MQMASKKERDRIYTQEIWDRYGWLIVESDQKLANDAGAHTPDQAPVDAIQKGKHDPDSVESPRYICRSRSEVPCK